jgi:hypothetical protein
VRFFYAVEGWLLLLDVLGYDSKGPIFTFIFFYASREVDYPLVKTGNSAF